MASDYIRLKQFGESNETGFKINASLITDFDFALGVDTVDLSLPSSTDRKFLNISGLKQDFTFGIELIDDGNNKAFSIDDIGNETNELKFSTAEQLNFVLDNMISPNLGAFYEIYLDWLGRTFKGAVTIRGRARGDDSFNRVVLIATLKQSTNILGL